MEEACVNAEDEIISYLLGLMQSQATVFKSIHSPLRVASMDQKSAGDSSIVNGMFKWRQARRMCKSSRVVSNALLQMYVCTIGENQEIEHARHVFQQAPWLRVGRWSSLRGEGVWVGGRGGCVVEEGSVCGGARVCEGVVVHGGCECGESVLWGGEGV